MSRDFLRKYLLEWVAGTYHMERIGDYSFSSSPKIERLLFLITKNSYWARGDVISINTYNMGSAFVLG